MWGWMGMGGEVEVGVVLVGVCPGCIASSTFLLLLRLLILVGGVWGGGTVARRGWWDWRGGGGGGVGSEAGWVVVDVVRTGTTDK